MASAGVSAVNPCANVKNDHKYPSFAECVASFKLSKLKDDHAPSPAILKILDEARAKEKAVQRARAKARLERKTLRKEAKEQRQKEQREQRQKVLDFILSRRTQKRRQKCKI